MASQVFWRRALSEPGQIVAIEPDGTTHAAGDLLAQVNQLTHGLRGGGLRPECLPRISPSRSGCLLAADTAA